MNLLFVAVHMGDGAGKAISGMAIQCQRRGNSVKIIILDRPHKDTYIVSLEDRGIPVIIEPNDDELLSAIEESDEIILNWWGHPLGIRFLLRFPQVLCRLLIWNHVNGCTYPYLPFIFLNMFSGVMFTSEYSMENMLWTEEERKTIENKSSIVCGMGNYDPEKYVPKDNYCLKDKFVVGYVGTLSYAKLNCDFLKYCEAVAARIPRVEFWLAGEENAELKRQIEERGLSKYFRFLGYIADTAEVYLQFDVLGYLLEEENYATTENVLLEAMAHALPIVVLDNPTERHIIYDGKNGYRVHTPKEYADKLIELCDSEDKRRIMGTRAREFAIQKYNESGNADRFLQICERAMKYEKKEYHFKDVMGKSTFEAFCFFAAKDGEIFVNCKDLQQVDQIKNCKDIFKGKGKGSVKQFAEYFPDEEQFRQIIDIWEKKDEHP